MYTAQQKGFTLIEMSIVLVIIGLIVGGVLVGQDLIRAAEVRATISQIEKYNMATNTFREKYGALPGDISASLVTQFSFTVAPARAGTAGLGDGNGIIEGFECNYGGPVSGFVSCGETAWFWEDLASNSHLIEGGFNSATGSPPTTGPTESPDGVIPQAKIGKGTYINIYAENGLNFYSLSAVASVDENGAIRGNPGVAVVQAYSIDKKIDDGYPQSGTVTAQYVSCCGTGTAALQWADPDGTITGPPYATATAGSPTSCFDNGNVGGATRRYSLTQNNGAGVNCALSFRFQ